MFQFIAAHYVDMVMVAMASFSAVLLFASLTDREPQMR